MRFSCVKENLEYALTIAERFTGKNVTLPILSNCLLETSGSKLLVIATNLEYAVQITVPGKTEKEGKVSVPAKIFSSLIHSLKDERIDLEEKQGNLLVKTGQREGRINGLTVDDFPLIPKIKKTATVSLDLQAFRDGLVRVLPAVSPSEFKPELMGVYFKSSGNRLRLASTDTFRLAEKTLTLEERPEGDGLSFILPQRVAQELARLEDESGGDIKMSLGENQVVFETQRVKIISRLIEGVFPEYTAIVPKSFELEVFISRQDLIEVVHAASIFSSKLQDITLAFRTGSLEISTANPEVGEYKTKIPLAGKGGDLRLSFNYRYLLDGLMAMSEEEIFLGCNSDNSPSLFRNKDDGSLFYVLMPIRFT